MSFVPPPLLREHERCADEVGREVLRRLGVDPAHDPNALRDGLVQVFAHYVELLSERLNRVPALHQAAFLAYLDRAPAPPVPARVVLQFAPVAKNGPGPLVPGRTQVAAAPQANDAEPVVFETAADLPLVCARLERAVAVTVAVNSVPRQMVPVDDLVAPSGHERTMPADAVPLVRALHIGVDAVLGAPGLTRVEVQVGVDGGGALPAGVQPEWGIVQDGAFHVLVPESDTTNGLTRDGTLVFAGLPPWPVRALVGRTSRWLSCRLVPQGPGPTAAPATGAQPGGACGRMLRLSVGGSAVRDPLPFSRAFAGALALDLSKDFYPLGERPRFGDVLYLASGAFATPGARVVLDVTMTNPAGAKDAPIPPVSRAGNPRVQWEAATRRGWIAVAAQDGSASLTGDGEVALTMPDDVVATQVSGVDGGWLRMRLVSGSYLDAAAPARDGFPPALAPPSIAAITIGASVDYPAAPTELVVLENELELSELELSAREGAATQAFVPFPPVEAPGAALYLGLAAGDGALPNRTLHFFASPPESTQRLFVRDAQCTPARPARWQVRGEGAWRDCEVRDDSDGLRRPGFVAVSLGADVAAWPGSTLDPARRWYWLRVLWDAAVPAPPLLRRLALNAVPALQQLSLGPELLGSSNGRPGQRFQSARAPVIGAVALEVGVPGAPGSRASAIDTARFSMIDTPAGLPLSRLAWEHWTRVDDFTASGADDRHFVLDRMQGAVSFGDGLHGRIPVPGANNIRLVRYHTGGGARGNLPAGCIDQLRTTIPYVDRAASITAAAGGRDTESPAALARSGAAWLRHRDRAIGCEDYADLARQAAPDVAWAACRAAVDLAADPLGLQAAPGVVSVVVVPAGSQARPQPPRALLEQVKRFLDARRPLGVDLVVLGPLYVAFGVEAEIVVAPGWPGADVLARCMRALQLYLDSSNGGGQDGWALGARPRPADVDAWMSAVAGVDHVRGLRLRVSEDLSGLLGSGNFLVCAGEHALRCAPVRDGGER